MKSANKLFRANATSLVINAAKLNSEFVYYYIYSRVALKEGRETLPIILGWTFLRQAGRQAGRLVAISMPLFIFLVVGG